MVVVMYEVLTSGGSVSISGLEYGLPLLVRAPNTLRNLAVASRPLSEPNRVMVSCSLDTGVREALGSLVVGTGVGCVLCQLWDRGVMSHS